MNTVVGRVAASAARAARDEDLAEDVRRARVVRDQALELAADAVRHLEARVPGGHTVALRGRLEEVRGRAVAEVAASTGRPPVS